MPPVAGPPAAVPLDIGFVAVSVRDPEAEAAFYADVLGMRPTARDSRGAVYLACPHEPNQPAHHRLILEPAAGPGLGRTAWRLSGDAAVAAAADRLRALGLPVDEAPAYPGRAGEAIVVADPDGNRIELFGGLAADPPAAGGHPFRVRRLGHVTLRTGDPSAQEAFHTQVLGLRLSDRRGGDGVWLRCGADHHSLAVLRHPDGPGMHHHAYELAGWEDVRRACDWLAERGGALEVAPTHHFIGENVSVYFFDPEGVRIELYCDMLQIRDEAAHQPRDWPADIRTFNRWGVPPAPSYFGGS